MELRGFWCGTEGVVLNLGVLGVELRRVGTEGGGTEGFWEWN